MANDVRLWALSTCGWCRKVHEFLVDRGVEHELIVVDLLDDTEKAKARAELTKYNPRRSYPTTVVNGKKVIHGFHEDQLLEALEL